MTEEFDREIDTLLRQAAQSVDTVSDAQNLHLDADEINAFAENALPAKARLRTMEHLADCSRCRKILSDVIAFHSETKPEAVPLIETKTIPVAPWYKRFFVFPQMAYLMGALALLFTGIVAVVVLQSSNRENSSQIAQIEEKQLNDSGPSAESVNSYSNTNAVSNAAMSANTSSGLASSNSNAAPAEAARNKGDLTAPSATPAAPSDRAESDKAAGEPKPTAQPNEEAESAKKEKAASPSAVAGAAPPAPARRNDYTVDGTSDAASSRQAEQQPAQNSVSQNQSVNQTNVMPDSRSVRDLPVNGRSTQSLMKISPESAAKSRATNADKDDEKKSESRSVGGKQFRRADGVWYDVNYKSQKTINLSRASDGYKKLEGGLRSIADNLGGVVVIVWKGKAYRIQ